MSARLETLFNHKRTINLYRNRKEALSRCESPIEDVREFTREFQVLCLIFADGNVGSSVCHYVGCL